MLNFLIIIITSLSSLYPLSRGWTHPETGWQILSGTNMCLFLIQDTFVDNELSESNHQDAIGIFYDNQCIGWSYYSPPITIIPTIGDDGQNPQFPIEGDQVDFYIYDKSTDQILVLQTLSEIPTWTLWGSHTMPVAYGCSLNLPIQINGNCPNICDGDLNNDTIVDILDIVSIVDIIVFCDECEDVSCGDIDGNSQIDIQDILIIINLILGN